MELFSPTLLCDPRYSPSTTGFSSKSHAGAEVTSLLNAMLEISFGYDLFPRLAAASDFNVDSHDAHNPSLLKPVPPYRWMPPQFAHGIWFSLFLSKSLYSVWSHSTSSRPCSPSGTSMSISGLMSI